MSIGSSLKHTLGIIEGILIPGASESTTNLDAYDPGGDRQALWRGGGKPLMRRGNTR